LFWRRLGGQNGMRSSCIPGMAFGSFEKAKARQGKARQGKARQGKARKGKHKSREISERKTTAQTGGGGYQLICYDRERKKRLQRMKP
jgi:hypothetical protein